MKEILPAHLPPGWQQVPLEGVVIRMSNGITKRQTKDGQGFAVSRIETISQGVVDFSRVGYLADLTPCEVENYRLHAGDILFSHINSDLHLGKTAVVSTNADPLLHGMNLLLIRADQKKAVPVFLHWLLNYYRVAGLFMSIAQHAVNQSSINQAKLKNLPVILPPLAEQHEIVAEIEKQFTRLEAGVAGLRRVQANLKRYRAAVLKAACEGKLVPTEAELAREREIVAAASRRWSSEEQRRRDASATILVENAKAEENQSRDGSATQEGQSYETGAQLLERILTERRHKWTGKGKYKEPAKSNTANLPPLPEGWAWAALDSITNALGGYAFESKKFCDSGFQVLKMANVRMGRIDLSQRPSFITEVDQEVIDKYKLLDGDVVVTLTGSRKKEDYGYVALIKNAGPLLLNQRIARLRCVGGALPAFLEIGMQSKDFRKRFFSYETGNVGQGNVGMTAITRESIPVPPLAEQQRIVAEVDRRLSMVEQLEAVVNANLQRATRLRQSILQRAFDGNLLNEIPDTENR
ncbi:MAG: restriction endonuclease subunit S [Candidatus Binatia bacterium]